MRTPNEIKNTADVRKFLAEVMVDVRYGHCEVNVAEAVADVAAQFNHSLSLELKAMKMIQGQGSEPKLGALPMTLEQK